MVINEELYGRLCKTLVITDQDKNVANEETKMVALDKGNAESYINGIIFGNYLLALKRSVVSTPYSLPADTFVENIGKPRLKCGP